MDNMYYVTTILNTAIALCAIGGGLVAFFRSRKAEVVKIQDETITALQQQIDTIKARQESLEKENLRLRQIIETIQEALKQRGIHITIDGDLVTIKENNTTTMHKRTKRPAPAAEAKDNA